MICNGNVKPIIFFFCLSVLLLKLVKRTFSPPLILPFLCLMELEINVVLLVYLLHSITGDVSTSLVGSISVKIYSALNLSLNKKKKKGY